MDVLGCAGWRFGGGFDCGKTFLCASGRTDCRRKFWAGDLTACLTNKDRHPPSLGHRVACAMLSTTVMHQLGNPCTYTDGHLGAVIFFRFSNSLHQSNNSFGSPVSTDVDLFQATSPAFEHPPNIELVGRLRLEICPTFHWHRPVTHP